VAISITLDKVLAKKIVASAGLDTPRFQTFLSAREKPSQDLRYPLIVKPVAEGSSKGIMNHAVVHNKDELKERVGECVELYRQPVLVEEYIPGREFTVGLIGNGRPVVLPPLEVQFTKAAGEFPVYSYEIKQEVIEGAHYLCPAPIGASLRKRIEKRAKEIFRALELRDLARVDFRMDEDDNLYFLEVNPLPGLTPGYSDLCIIGKAIGLNHDELVGYILLAAMKRCGISKKYWPKLEPLRDRVARLYEDEKVDS
jgi:D-alanine-D-alanine ligase